MYCNRIPLCQSFDVEWVYPISIDTGRSLRSKHNLRSSSPTRRHSGGRQTAQSLKPENQKAPLSETFTDSFSKNVRVRAGRFILTSPRENVTSWLADFDVSVRHLHAHGSTPPAVIGQNNEGKDSVTPFPIRFGALYDSRDNYSRV